MVNREGETMPETSAGRATPEKGAELATLAGGCFWCTEAVFAELRGVLQVVPGYTGGTEPHPSYRQVCAGTTGHAEAVQILFDPSVISFTDLLHIFFTTHDPTTLNRQGPDAGTQYRSAIYYHTEEQKRIAERVIKEITAERIWSRPIVTEVTAAPTFYRAEDYHHEYFLRNGEQPYCQAIIAPKVAKLRKQYREKLKSA
jgi:peptide-methionine (S)-S-oxide reductase